MHRLWTAHLKAIETRLAKIEAALNSWRAELNGGSLANGSTARRRISLRDVGVSDGTMAVATALWWVVRLLQAAEGSG